MSYRRLPNGTADSDVEDELTHHIAPEPPPFSWPQYGVFALLGVAMLWAWNMFLAAAPYFQRRFRSNKTILANFQASEIFVSALCSLSCMVILAKFQAKASYPRRIFISLSIYTAANMLLALSTKAFRQLSTEAYFVFVLIMVLASAIATAFIQNGTFAYVNSFERQEYMQGVMAGQALAGVLPPVVQIVSVLSAGTAGQESSTSALAYFLTAVGISAVTSLAFLWHLRQQQNQQLRRPKPHLNSSYSDNVSEDGDPVTFSSAHPIGSSTDNLDATQDHVPDPTLRKGKVVPLIVLVRKLFFPATAVFINFAITMVFPVLTPQVLSTNPSPPPLFRPAAFIPLAFLVWNVGDLLGRQFPLVPRLSLGSRPRILLLLALLRIIFIPLYFLCNIHKPGSSAAATAAAATVKSDWFYMLVVQFPFGLSNGYIGSCCMMGSSECVEEDEREAAGAFMALLLVAGLTTGSLCSFFISNSI